MAIPQVPWIGGGFRKCLRIPGDWDYLGDPWDRLRVWRDWHCGTRPRVYGFGYGRIGVVSNIHMARQFFLGFMKSILPNKIGAGNGAGALPFHVECLGRAVPDLSRYA